MVEHRLKKNKRQRSLPSAIQRLYETCKVVFSDLEAGTVPAHEDVDRLRAVIDNIKASDVGLTPDLPYFWNVEPEGVIPLHNHPGMTVFSKLLFGTMHIKSYDWFDGPKKSQESINSSQLQPLGAGLAMVKTDATFSAPCETSILYPAAGGNMHRFTAMTPCAVLDVLGPPYSDPDGRHCTYYNDLPYGDVRSHGENKRYAWLEEREKPDDFFVLGAKYRGPRILEL